MEFKKLELESEPKGLRKLFTSQHTKRSLLYALVGALLSFLLYYFSEGISHNTFIISEIVKSLLIGAAFGLFIANSPCARGRC